MNGIYSVDLYGPVGDLLQSFDSLVGAMTYCASNPIVKSMVICLDDDNGTKVKFDNPNDSIFNIRVAITSD